MLPLPHAHPAHSGNPLGGSLSRPEVRRSSVRMNRCDPTAYLRRHVPGFHPGARGECGGGEPPLDISCPTFVHVGHQVGRLTVTWEAPLAQQGRFDEAQMVKRLRKTLQRVAPLDRTTLLKRSVRTSRRMSCNTGLPLSNMASARTLSSCAL